MKIFERQILQCDNVRSLVSAHCHIKGCNQATAQYRRGLQQCAGCAHLPHILKSGRTLPVSPLGKCADVRLPRRAHCHIANVRPLDAPHNMDGVWA